MVEMFRGTEPKVGRKCGKLISCGFKSAGTNYIKPCFGLEMLMQYLLMFHNRSFSDNDF